MVIFSAINDFMAIFNEINDFMMIIASNSRFSFVQLTATPLRVRSEHSKLVGKHSQLNKRMLLIIFLAIHSNTTNVELMA